VVKRPDVIDAYVRLSKDMRSKFIDQDEQTREELRKDKKKYIIIINIINTLLILIII